MNKSLMPLWALGLVVIICALAVNGQDEPLEQEDSDSNAASFLTLNSRVKRGAISGIKPAPFKCAKKGERCTGKAGKPCCGEKEGKLACHEKAGTCGDLVKTGRKAGRKSGR